MALACLLAEETEPLLKTWRFCSSSAGGRKIFISASPIEVETEESMELWSQTTALLQGFIGLGKIP